MPKLAEAQAGPKGAEVKTFTMEEVEKHDTRESAWFVHAGQVGHISSFTSKCWIHARQYPPKRHHVVHGLRFKDRFKGPACHLIHAPWHTLSKLEEVGGGSHLKALLHGGEATLLCYILQVYDGTPFMKDHPGGADSILLVAGTDATEEFNAIHSEKAKKQLLQYVIGRLASSAHQGLLTLHHSLKPVDISNECQCGRRCSDSAFPKKVLRNSLAWQGWHKRLTGVACDCDEGCIGCSRGWQGACGAGSARADSSNCAESQEAAQVQIGPEATAQPQCPAFPLCAAITAAQVWAPCGQARVPLCRVSPFTLGVSLLSLYDVGAATKCTVAQVTVQKNTWVCSVSQWYIDHLGRSRLVHLL